MVTQSAMLYCALVFVCLFILFYIMCTVRETAPGLNSSNYYCVFLLCYIICCTANIADVLFEGGLLPVSESTWYFVNCVYELFLVFSSISWIMFSEENQNGFGNSRIIFLLVASIAFLLITVLILTTRFHHGVFYLEGGHFRRGDQFLLPVIVPIVFVLYTSLKAFVRCFQKKYYAQRRKNFLLAAYAATVIAAELIQYRLGRMLPIRIIFVTLLVFIIHEVRLRHQITVDAMTQINNRGALEHHLAAKLQDSDSDNLYLIMLDVDDFKTINDTYGHMEGDRALKNIADIIKSSVPQSFFAARFGGDEFSVVGKATSSEEIRAICDQIRNNLHEFCRREKLPYDLCISTGFASKSKEIMSLPDLLSAADVELYRTKNAKELVR